MGLLLAFGCRRPTQEDLPKAAPTTFAEEFAAIDISPQENAFELYRRAADQHDQADLYPVEAIMEFSEHGNWRSVDEEAVQWLERNRGALELWYEATGRPKSLGQQPKDYVDAGDVISVSGDLRTFVRLAMLEASRLRSRGEMDKAWDWLRAALRCSRHCQMHGGFASRVLGMSYYAFTARFVRDWADDERTTSGQLEQALNDLKEIDGMTPPRAWTIKYEYFATLSHIERLHQKHDPYKYREARARKAKEVSYDARYLHLEPELSRRLAHLAFGGLIAHADDSWTAIANQDAFALMFKLNGGGLTRAEFEEWIARSAYAPDTSVTMDFPYVFHYYFEDEAVQRLLRTVLALQWRRREHGQFPDTLRQLVGRYLDEVPSDPFAAGVRLDYRRIDDEAVVWSVGPDGVDDQGTPRAPSGPDADEAPYDIVYATDDRVFARDQSLYERLDELISHGDHDRAIALVRDHPELVEPVKDGSDLLHLAAGWGEPEIVKALLDLGADVDRRENGETPLHAACSSYVVSVSEAVEVARLLLQAGADPNAANDGALLHSRAGNTPLHGASRWSKPAVVQLLLDHGADPTVENAQGETPLIFARREIQESPQDRDAKKVLKLLSAHGAGPE